MGKVEDSGNLAPSNELMRGGVGGAVPFHSVGSDGRGARRSELEATAGDMVES